VIQKLVWENVKHRPLRTVLSALLIAIPVTLVLTLAGLSKGLLEDAARRYRGVGADIIIRPKGSSFLSLGSAPIDERLLGFIQKQPHVRVVTGLLLQPLGSPLSWGAGIDVNTFNQMSGGFDSVSGGPLAGPDDVLVDQYYAEEHKLRTGQTVKLLNHDWYLRGIVTPGKLNRVFFDLRRLQELTGNSGNVNTIYVKLDDSRNIDSAIAALKQPLDGYPIYSMQEFTALFNANGIPALAEFTEVVVGIAVLIGFAVVCLSMYMAVLQRTREIGILKALGASRWYVLNIILSEAVLLAISGTVAGIAMSYGVQWLLRTFAPATFSPAVDPSWWPIAAAIALTGAVLGALYPGLHAAAMDPIEALSYE
jgi:putative ABC transport system permease protein